MSGQTGASSVWRERPHRGVAALPLSAVPVQAQVIHDMGQCVRRFADVARAAPGGAGDSSLRAFHEVWSALRFSGVFGMRGACGRIPGMDETESDWAEALLREAVRHVQPATHPGFEERVGGLFLIYTLYDQQPRRAAEPRAVVPLTEEQCPALDTLLAELRQPCPPPKRWRQTNQPAKHPNYARSGPCGRGRAAPTRGASDAFSTPRVATLPSPLRRRHADGFAALHALWAGYAFRPVESGANPL